MDGKKMKIKTESSHRVVIMRIVDGNRVKN